MKKYFIMILAALSIACAVAGIACSKGPKYYKFNYDEFDGITYTSDVWNDADVKEGYVVAFAVEIDWKRVALEEEDKPYVVTANGVELTADESGKYYVTVTGNTLIKVEGVYRLTSYEVTFDRGDPHNASYTSDDGDVEKGITVTAGTEITFRVKKSAYYVGNYQVCANTRELEPQDDGSYKITVTETTTISVKGLKQDTSFAERADGGSGTPSDPFKIERPIDLYAMADLTSNSFYLGAFGTAYYEMTKDIDLDGEQLYVIGDSTTGENGITSFFGGNFNGNGHKVTNFYISDSIIEQSGYTSVFLPYIGMFGYVGATLNGPARISNLSLENFEIKVNAANRGTVSVVGGLVGYGAGVEITGCSVNGKITIAGDTNYFTYAGGLAGQLQAVYQSDDLRFSSIVRSCSSSVDLGGDTGYLYAGGGLVGFMSAGNEKASAVIVNSYSTGHIYGVINAGGVVGYAGTHTSVLNCYSTGIVEAYSSVSGAGLEEYANSYAGGIVGYINYGSIVANSFSTSPVYANATAGQGITGDIAARIDGVGNNDVASFDAYLYNCHLKSSVNEQFLKEKLNWQESDWDFSGTFPVVNGEATEISYNVTIKSNNAVVETISVTNAYMPMYDWNKTENGIPEFITVGNMRSYAYYFDSACTRNVPYSFIPTGEITFYAAVANYTEVAGYYYIGDTANKEFIQLTNDGKLLYNKGALNYESYYTYDGQQVVLYDCPAFIVTLCVYDSLNRGYIDASSYYTARASVNNPGELTIVNLLDTSMVDQFDSQTYYISSAKSHIYTNSNPLQLTKRASAVSYTTNDKYKGTWLFNYSLPVNITFNEVTTAGYGTAVISYTRYGETQVRYTVGNDGSIQLYNKDVEYGSFTYSESNNAVILLGRLYVPYDGGSVKTEVALCKYDNFRGTWVSNDATIKEIYFDGLGQYNFNGSGDSLAVRGSVKINGTTNVSYSDNKFTYNNTVYTVTVSGSDIIINSVTFKQRDEWYGLDLVDASGHVYSFDGRGSLTGGGKYKIGGEEQSDTYTTAAIAKNGSYFTFKG
ncbi:MAG: hypothetical protein HDP34_05705, partial [Clostridia bacterium]|nr:hypothetical protein [Clostridia bacterium]